MVRRRFPLPKPKYTKKTESEPAEKPPKAVYGDPAGDDSYQSMKNRLWNRYQGKYYPAFMKFRNEVTMHVLEIGRNPAKNGTKSVKGIAVSRSEYMKTAMDAFSEYLEALTMSYIHDKAHSQGVDFKETVLNNKYAKMMQDAGPAPKEILTRSETKQKSKQIKAAKKKGKKI